MAQYRSNIPGWDYIERLTESWNKAVLLHGEIMNEAFADMKAGTYDWPQAFQKWARCLDGYAGAWIEASRGPGYIPRPAWLHFDYSFELNNALKGSAKVERAEPNATGIDAGPFTSLDGREPLQDLYQYTPTFTSLRNDELVIELNRDKLREAREKRKNMDGQYLSFVFARNRGAEPPLVIVVLTIRDSSSTSKAP